MIDLLPVVWQPGENNDFRCTIRLLFVTHRSNPTLVFPYIFGKESALIGKEHLFPMGAG